MRRFKSARFARRRATRFVRGVIRNSGPTYTSRVFNTAQSNIGAAATNTYSLLTAKDDPDDTVISNMDTASPTIAEVEAGSRIKAIQFSSIWSGSGGTQFQWALMKNPDADIAADLDAVFKSDDTTAAREIRAHCLAAGIGVVASSSQIASIKAFVKRKRLRKLGLMRDGDRLQLWVRNSGSATITGEGVEGRIWTTRN